MGPIILHREVCSNDANRHCQGNYTNEDSNGSNDTAYKSWQCESESYGSETGVQRLGLRISKIKFEKPKIKTKTKTEMKRVRTPTQGRFAPLAQAPPLAFLFSFSFQFTFDLN